MDRKQADGYLREQGVVDRDTRDAMLYAAVRNSPYRRKIDDKTFYIVYRHSQFIIQVS